VNPDPDTDTIRIQGFDDQKVNKKNTAEIFLYLFFDQKLQFTGPSYRRSLQPSKENIKHGLISAQ
jgi:hypothetical protein